MDSPAGSAGAEQQHKENEQHNENEGQLLEMQPAKPGQLAATAQATPMAAAAAAADCSELQQPANGISAPSAPGRNAQADGGVAGAAPAAPREQSVIDLVGPPTARQPAAARAANALASALAPAQVQPGEVIDLLSDSDSEGPGRQAAMQPLKEACSATSPPAAALRASSSSSSVIDLLSDEEGDERASQPQQQVQRSEPLSKLEDEGARQQQPSQQQQQQQPLEERQEMRGSTHRQLSMQQPAVKSEPGVSEPAAAAAPAKPAAAAAAQVQPPVVAAAAAAQVQLPVVAAAAVSIKLEQQGLTQQQQQQAAPADQPHPVPPIAAAAAAAEEPQGSGSTQPADASGSQPGSSAGVPGPVGSSQRSHGTPSKRAGAEPEAQPPTKVWRVQEAVEQAAEERLQQQQKQAADSAGMPATAGYGEASAAERSHADSHISDLGTSRPAAGSPPASGKPAADDNAQQEQQQSQWQPAADVAAEAEADAEAAAAVQATAAALLTACEQQVAAAAAAAAAGSPAAAAAAVAAAGGGEEEPMPDPSDAGAMLRWLRARIPAQLLETYREPHSVSVAEAEKTAERLQLYEEKMKRIRENNPAQRKHDLVAAKKVEEAYPRWGLWGTDPGHKAGIAVGQRFSGRGPLKALGIHTTYFTGIQTGGPNGVALAICLSGGYEDDDDHGDWFWYTGEGGRNDKTNTQVKDQAWVRGNAALRNAQLNGTPVRVVRAAARNGDPKQGFDYTYDGLYVIIRAGMEPSQSGPLVCRFLLVGLPGHYKANKSVSWVELRGFRNNLRLAAQASSEGDEEEEEGEEVEAPARRTKRARTQKAAAPSSAAAAAAAGAPRRHKKPKAAASPLPRGLRPVVQDGAWLRAQQARPGFLCADISEGAEVRKIPAFNDVDDEPLPELQYVRTSIVGTDAAQSLLDEGRSVMPSTWCGRELGRKKGHYNEHGLLLYTRGQGAWECGSACNSTACNHNRAVSTLGLRLPLEVFRTRGKGWGLRCAEDIPSGAFVCSYEGELLSSREAEERRGADFYLFDLDHFVIMHADCSVKERVRQALPGLPFEAREDSDHLVIDAHKIGNLARFLNHSCSPNLMKQPVLIPGDSGLRYRMCFFAYGDIKKGTELVYDYSYEIGTVPGLQIPCHCGARNCKGRLL